MCSCCEVMCLIPPPCADWTALHRSANRIGIPVSSALGTAHSVSHDRYWWIKAEAASSNKKKSSFQIYFCFGHPCTTFTYNGYKNILNEIQKFEYKKRAKHVIVPLNFLQLYIWLYYTTNRNGNVWKRVYWIAVFPKNS